MNMKNIENHSTEIPTQVKNVELVSRRRRQIVDAAVQLFIENGFHKTTTREIAKAAGFSIGSLYEYVASKEDILYMVCDAIHTEVEQSIAEAVSRKGNDKKLLIEVIREYFLVCHRWGDHILMIYQETRSLPQQWKRKILENELAITGLFVRVLADVNEQGHFKLNEREIELYAHNITVMGHMWTFRRWFLARHYSIEEYIRIQTEFFLNVFNDRGSR